MDAFIGSTLQLAVPLLLCACAYLFSEKSGVENIALEGLMLTGCLFGVLGSYWTGSPIVGALLAMFMSMLLSLLFAFFTITLHANQIVAGVALNLLADGITISLNRLFLTPNNVVRVNGFDTLPIPVLSDIPVIGPFFNQTLLGYFAYIMVFVTWFVFYKTDIGLKIRSVGDNPTACDTVGIHVNALRYKTVLYTGLMSGLAGAFISTGQLSAFSEGMVSGRGFIAFSAVIFGNYTPLGVFRACLIFAVGMAAQYRFQALDTPISYYFWMMLPYLITVVALCMHRKKSNKAKFIGVPYIKS